MLKAVPAYLCDAARLEISHVKTDLSTSPVRETPSGGRRLRRFLAGAAAALVAAAGIVAVAVPATATPGHTGVISGSVSLALPDDDWEAAGAEDVEVTAYLLDEGGESATTLPEWTTYTEADGTFSFGELPVGEWVFSASYRGGGEGADGAYRDYVTRFRSATDDRLSGVSIDEVLWSEVSSGNVFTWIGEGDEVDLPFALNWGGIISGQVTSSSNAPLAGQPVQLWRYSGTNPGVPYSWEWSLSSEAVTGVDGGYQFTGLSGYGGSWYTVRAGGVGGYAPQFYDNRYTALASEADHFLDIHEKQDPLEPQIANFVLSKGATVSGTVKDSTGKAAPGIVVTAYHQPYQFSDAWEPWGEPTTTSSKGTYTLRDLPPGTGIRVGFAAPADATAAYAEQFWPAKTYVEDATTITLAAGKSKTGVNATLVRSGMISGTISLSTGGHPAGEDLWIYACPVSVWDSNPCALSEWSNWEGDVAYDDETGVYRISPLPAGKYMVVVRFTGAGNFQNEWWNDAHASSDASIITLAKSGSVTGRDFVLDPGATFSGTVRLEGDPLADVWVSAYPVGVSVHDTEYHVKTAPTDANGQYSLSGLPAGEYYIRAEYNDAGAPWKFYGGYTEREATAVLAAGTNATSGLDIDLEAGGTIAGTVRGEDDGDPIYSLVRLEALGSHGTAEVWNRSFWTDGDGRFEFEGLAPGRYLLRAYDYYGTSIERHIDSYYGAPGGHRSEATVIEVAGGEELDLEFLLPLGGAYTGRVVDDGGDPVPGAWVQTLDGSGGSMETDQDGQFTIGGLRAGDHDLVVLGPQGFVGEYIVAAAPTTYNAEPVVLDDIVLARGSEITGVVIGTNGKGVPDVYVSAYVRNASGLVYVRGTDVDKGGNFALDGLPAEPIYLFFEPESSKSPYAPQFLGGGDDWSFSEPVQLAEPGARVFREVRLLPGGGIKGTVKNKQTGRAVKGIPVYATASSGTSTGYGYGQTNSKGAYSIPGLVAGSYDVHFNDYGTSPGATYGIHETQVIVADRKTTTVNASLAPAYRVSGVARDENGDPLAGVLVEAIPVGDGPRYELTTNASGAYSFTLVQGEWKLFFRDPDGRVGSLYYGGTTSLDAATAIVVGSKAITGRDVTLPAATGSIDVTRIFGAEDGDPEGTVWIHRIEGGEVVSSHQVGRDWRDLLWKLFPIVGLSDGTYRLVIEAESRGGTNGGMYDTYLSGDITVENGEVTNLGEIDLGEPLLYSSTWEWPKPVPGDEPVVAHDGSPQVGESVALVNGEWNVSVDDFDGEFYIQWLRDGKAIPRATGTVYWLAPGDAGKQITAYIGMAPYGGWGDGEVGYLADLDEPVAKAAAPQTTDVPVISGRGAVGQKLTADPGLWDLSGLTFGYQWTRDGIPIAKATAKTYTLTTADVGAIIAVEITAKRTGFEDGFADAALDAPVVPKVALKQTKKSKVTATADGWLVTTGTWSQKGVTYSYEWREYAADGTEYTVRGTDSGLLADADLFARDTKVTVALTGAKAGYTTTTVEVPVRLGPVPTIDGGPELLGEFQVGLVNGVDLGSATITPATATLSYQWLKNGKAIKGATKATYTPVPGDAGATLSVRVTAKADGFRAPTAPQVVLSAAAPVAAGAAFVATTPWISGTPAVGRALSAQVDGWSPTPAKVTYQWLRDGVAIKKATKSTYTPVAADAGRTLTVRITASRPGYQSVTLVTHPDDAVVIDTLAPQMLTRPVLTGTVAVGSKVGVNPGTWDVKPTSYRYQWYLNAEPIPGATASSYTPIAPDLGEELTVVVTPVRSGYPEADGADANSVTVVEGVALKASKAPALTVGGKTVKSVKSGQTITTTAGTWPVSALTLHYQWQVDRADGEGWVDLEGQNRKTLHLDAAEYGDVTDAYLFRVEVTATRTGFATGEPAYSKALPLKR